MINLMFINVSIFIHGRLHIKRYSDRWKDYKDKENQKVRVDDILARLWVRFQAGSN